MSTDGIVYGDTSPFGADERATIESVYQELQRATHGDAAAMAKTVREQVANLNRIGDALAQYPSPLDEQSLGTRQRGLNTLIDSLSRSNPANFDFFLPTGALLGRALDMAESNFYRLLRHICIEVVPEDRRQALQDRVSRCLRTCLYTKLAEELLSGIASDHALDRGLREKAVAALAHIWEGRLTYRVSHFFPLLEATWEARQRIHVTGGTLLGTQELFELLREGADPLFLDYFCRAQHSENEIEAFREFLFGTPSEELERLSNEMRERGVHSISVTDAIRTSKHDVATVFYEFFRSRMLLAAARRLHNLPGPKRTAEGYVMVHYLEQLSLAEVCS